MSVRYGSRAVPEPIEEDRRPLGSVSWADTFHPTEAVHAFNDPRCPDTASEARGARNGCSNIPVVATWNAHDQYRAMNRRKGVEEE
jgi:hypothetical protein